MVSGYYIDFNSIVTDGKTDPNKIVAFQQGGINAQKKKSVEEDDYYESLERGRMRSLTQQRESIFTHFDAA